LYLLFCEESDLEAIDVINSFLNFDACTKLSFWFLTEKKLNPCGFITLFIPENSNRAGGVIFIYQLVKLMTHDDMPNIATLLNYWHPA